MTILQADRIERFMHTKRVKDCENVEEFFKKYYKPEGKYLRIGTLRNLKKDIEEQGWTQIFDYESKTCDIVTYFPYFREYQTGG